MLHWHKFCDTFKNGLFFIRSTFWQNRDNLLKLNVLQKPWLSQLSLEARYHPESEIGQLQISVIIHTIKNTYCSGFVVYLRTSLTWPRDKLLFRFKRVHLGAGRWNLSWEMGELEFCAHNSVATADLKSNAELWLALPLCAQCFWPMRN